MFELRSQFVEPMKTLTEPNASGANRPIEWEKISNAMAEVKPVVALARKAASKKGVWFDRDWSKGSWILFPEYAQMKGIARVLAWQALLKAHRGDRPGAIRDLNQLYAVSAHARTEPILIGRLVCVSIEATIFAALQEMMDMGKLRPADRAAIATLVPLQTVETEYSKVLWMENWLADASFGGPDKQGVLDSLERETGSGDSKSKSQIRGMLSVPYMLEANLANIWKTSLLLQDVVQKHQSNPRRLAVELDAVVDRLDARKSLDTILSRVFFTVYGNAVYARTRSIVQRDLMKALAEGKEGAPAGTDPFSGGPYRVKKEGSGFIVYSVGVDLKDNGGVLVKQKGGEGVDLGLRITK